MKISWILNGAIMLLMVIQSWAGEEDKKKKLQIGVKKRVDNCKTKSRKGDTLHMHYTVSVATHYTCIIL
jgi:hypothetical protein